VTELQATVCDWDAGSRAGRVLLDDGRRMDFPGESVQVRSLRVGQRVRLRVAADHVVALTISTLPFT
jgi:hypothetical protein